MRRVFTIAGSYETELLRKMRLYCDPGLAVRILPSSSRGPPNWLEEISDVERFKHRLTSSNMSVWLSVCIVDDPPSCPPCEFRTLLPTSHP